MYNRYRIIFLVVAAMSMLVSGGSAQVDNDISVSATGGSSSVTVTINMNIGGDLPTSWVGWVVDRRTIGICEPEVRVRQTTPFPVGAQTYLVSDGSGTAGITYYYRVYAVDDQGNRHYLGSPPEFPPGYNHDDYASIGDAGIVARGFIVDLGWTVGIEVCPGFCWEPIAFITDAPPELAAFADFQTPVEIHGSIDNEFEGPYISGITAWSPIGGCEAVPTTGTSWGGLKAGFR